MRKPNKIRQILAAFIVVAVTALAVTLYLELPMLRKKVSSVSRLPRNIDISMRTVTYSETRDGVRKWVLEAQQADVAQKDNRVYLTKPRFVVYLQRQPGRVTLDAGRAVYDIKSRDVMLNDKVVATSDEGMNVETEKILYDAGRSLLSSKDHVRIMHRNATVEGDGMELHTVGGTIKLLGNVSATLKSGGVK
jgi:LPS export ABC transporter protein LptC